MSTNVLASKLRFHKLGSSQHQLHANRWSPSRRDRLVSWHVNPASAQPTPNNRLHTSCRASTTSSSLVNFLTTTGPPAPTTGAPTVSPVPFIFPALTIAGAALYAGLIGTGMDPGLKLLAVAAPALTMQGLVPALDALLGPRMRQPNPTSSPLEAIAPALTCVAHIIACLCTYTAAATAPLNPPLLAALTYSTAISGIPFLAACHELVHSRNKPFQAASELFLAWTWWHPYSRQHPYHHLTMCTPDDFTTAHKGVNVYQFAPMYIAGSYVKCWLQSVAECAKAGQPTLSPHNKALTGLLTQLGLTAAIGAALGPLAAALHLAVSGSDLFLMAAFDYVLHYGLSRPRLSGSAVRYAPVSHLNSWNSLYPLENAALFNVAMHSDHHMTASKTYPLLDPKEGTPMLPAPILAVSLLSLVPPLWTALMDARVDEVNARHVQLLEEGSLSSPLPVALAPTV